MKKTLIINRQGAVTVDPKQATDFQCVAKGHTTYYYESRVTMSDPQLDDRGFIADHTEIHKSLQSLCSSAAIRSCELLSLDMADCIAKLLDAKKMRYDEIYVKVSPSPSGSLSFMEARLVPNTLLSTSNEVKEVSQPAETHRILTLEELKTLGASADSDGDLWIPNQPGYFYKNLLFMAGTAIPADMTLLGTKVRFTLDDDSKEVYLWATTLGTLWKDYQASLKSAPETRYRFMTMEEVKGYPHLDRSEPDPDGVKSETGLYVYNWEVNAVAGRPLTYEEIALYLPRKGTEAYITVRGEFTNLRGHNTSEASIPVWMVTTDPLPVVTAVPVPTKVWRSKSIDEIIATPGVVRDGRNYYKSGVSRSTTLVPTMHAYLNTVLPDRLQQQAEALSEDQSMSWDSWAWHKWMLTTDPVVELSTRPRIKTLGELASDPELREDADGIFKTRAITRVRNEEYAFTPEMKGLAGKVLTVRQQRTLANDGKASTTAVDGTTFTIVPWMVTNL